jgi:hypothetical protein
MIGRIAYISPRKYIEKIKMVRGCGTDEAFLYAQREVKMCLKTLRMSGTMDSPLFLYTAGDNSIINIEDAPILLHGFDFVISAN